MSVAIKLGQEVVWGTNSAGTLTQGKILSLSKKTTGGLFEQKDENGETYSVIFFDDQIEISAEVLASTTGAAPARGAAINIGGVTSALVIDADENWKAGETKKFTINFKKWVA
ncbi:MAG: hypothetical protein ABIS50_15115 [Luteolibacter sp.]|uniref:hypothetical protein n=1 Tax=Luteolibacter sp. TaxID=1962973 RepID=UPI0032632162